MTLFDILISYFLLIAVVWYAGALLQWKMFTHHPHRERLFVLREQFITVILASCLSSVMYLYRQPFLEKFFGACEVVIIVLFVFRNICNWVRPELSERVKYHLGTVTFFLMVTALSTAFF